MVDDPLQKLGETFKKARLQSGLSLEDLSDKSRIQERHINNIEKGNRSELPEEAYLMGFINKLAKVLKLKNTQAIIDEYKNGESQYIVQNILNENHIKKESFNLNVSFLKIYHLYILIALLVIVGVFYLVKSGSAKKGLDDDSLITISKFEDSKTKSDPAKAEEKKPEAESISSFEAKEPKLKKEVIKNSSNKEFKIYGEGARSLKISMREVAWFQVYGIAAGKAIFEGDAYPNVEPSKFEFRDDIGFALASGNAGAFKVHDGLKKYILGESGQLIKWYYPEGAKYEYKQRLRR